MWFPDRNVLIKADPSAAFLLLAWEELLDNQTPDSYRPRLLSAESILLELAELAALADEDSRWQAHVDDVAAEARLLLAKDPVVQSEFPLVAHAIEHLPLSAGPNQIRDVVDVCVAQLGEYPGRVEQYLRSVARQLPKEKAGAHAALRLLATTAVARGVDVQRCRSIATEGLLQAAPVEVVDEIARVASCPTREWLCILGVEGPVGQTRALLSKTPLGLLPKHLKPVGPKGSAYLRESSAEVLVFMQAHARGPEAAIELAMTELRPAIDLGNLYHNDAIFRIADQGFAQTGREQALVSLRMVRARTLLPQRNAIARAQRILALGDAKDLPSEVIRALEQHSVALRTSDRRVRLTNLWIALETLVGAGPGGTGRRVRESIAPVIVGRRTRKLVKYAAICLHEFGLCREVRDSSGWFKRSSRQEVLPEELLLALSGVGGKEVLNALFSDIAVHPLLCNRVEVLRREFSDPREVRRHLKLSRKRVTWQLSRIYRARNHAVHNSKSDGHLPYLIENLHYYFMLSASRVLADVGRNRGWNVRQSLTHRRMTLDYLLTGLGQPGHGEPGPVVDDFVDARPPYAGEHLWSPNPDNEPAKGNA